MEPSRQRGVGRPPSLVMPDLPKMPLTTLEQSLYDFFMAAYQSEYPDLSPTDRIILHLAGLTYIKYLRVLAEEFETGHIITMSRQHPGTELRGLLDQLSVTRKARTARSKPEEDEAGQELKDYFLSMSNPTKQRPAQHR